MSLLPSESVMFLTLSCRNRGYQVQIYIKNALHSLASGQVLTYK